MIKLDRAICIFDLEATGTKVLEDRIVDICILRREPDGSESVFSSLVNPGVPIPPEVSAIHHITDDMVQDQPRLSDLAPKNARGCSKTRTSPASTRPSSTSPC